MKHKPLKRFGQNYLIDNNIVEKLVGLLNIKPGNSVIEIGPGKGAITAKLLDLKAIVTAIEIDRRVIEDLSNNFSSVKFIEADFLKFKLDSLFPENNDLHFIGNIPFNITSQILFKLLEHKKNVSEAVFIVQDEVAKRLNAKIGTKDYGILSVVFNQFATVEYCFKIPATVFKPKPRVNGAAIRITFGKDQKQFDEKLFIQTVKACFGNRRKVLKNSLKNSIFVNYDLSKINMDFTKRAEQLNQQDFIYLTQKFEEFRDGK